MKTIALRFSEQIAPMDGTIANHQTIIDRLGYVWYGKMGTPVAIKVAQEILDNESPKILLVSSGHLERYWAYITEISREKPKYKEFPEYYHNLSDKMNTWFKIVRFEKAPNNIMSHCYIASSNNTLAVASKVSMSPYFIIRTE